MSKLFEQFQDMPLWLEASQLMELVNQAVGDNPHPLSLKTLELAACLPTQLGYAGSNPNADIMVEISATLKLAILLEHHLKMIDEEKPAQALNNFKNHLIGLIEDDMDGEFDEDDN